MNLEAHRVVDFSFSVASEPLDGTQVMSVRLKKVCPQCDATLHVRKLACPCGHVFPAKSQQTKRKRPIESRQSDYVRKAAKRACETGEETMKRQTQNKEHMASIRKCETRGKALKPQAENKQHMASVRACETPDQTLHRRQSSKQSMSSTRKRNVSVECAVSAFHSEVKLGPDYVCTCCHRMMYWKSVIPCNKAKHQS